jgi:hypothetical protein
MKSKLFVFVCSFLILSACAEKSSTNRTGKLPKVKTLRLVAHLDSLANMKWQYFYTRVGTKYNSKNNKLNFKTILKMVNDSAINATITFAAIPMVHVLLTPDTLQIVNKRDKCYTKTLVDYLKKKFDFPFGFQQVEELLMGAPLVWNANDKFHQIENQKNYILSTQKKRFTSANIEEGKIDLHYYLSGQNLDIEKILINSPKDSTSILLSYSKRLLINNLSIPHQVEVQIYTPKDTIQVELEYQKVEINNEKKIVFIIPEQYDACN